jgi:hypothetical protein
MGSLPWDDVNTKKRALKRGRQNLVLLWCVVEGIGEFCGAGSKRIKESEKHPVKVMAHSHVVYVKESKINAVSYLITLR